MAFKILSAAIMLLLLTGCPRQAVKQPDPVDKVPVTVTNAATAASDTVRYVPDTASTLVELVTPMGNMKIEIYCATHLHKDNFLKLLEKRFYEGLLFHRVVSGFVIQGGDPGSRNSPPNKSLGNGGPGYNIPAEFDDAFVHVKGALCAARTGDDVNPEKESSGSQFYIVQGKPVTAETLDYQERTKGITYTSRQRKDYLTMGGSPQLDREYTVFGRVYEGLDVIDKIAATPVNGESRPIKNVTMNFRILKK